MEPNELCYQTIVEAASGLRRKELSPRELTEAAVKRIESLDGKLHCFITLTATSPCARRNRGNTIFDLAKIVGRCTAFQRLPVGLQIAAPSFEEVLLFRVAHTYEQATRWHKQRPAL
jgi:Asp-tRNA(Asn)/Glu-tRNA(Gln) amidotransferase A subunit family amidase